MLPSESAQAGEPADTRNLRGSGAENLQQAAIATDDTVDYGPRVEALFDKIADMASDERERHLDEQCADAPVLRERVLSLLDSEHGAKGILQESTASELDLAGADPAALMRNRTIGNYRITRKIGEGGMGVVFVAENILLAKYFVIKVLRAHLASNSEYVKRFKHEAKALASIDHPGIVNVHDVGTLPDGTMFIIMELLSGETLESRLRRVSRLSQSRAVGLIQQVVRTLVVVHERRIIHRDLKPDNLFLVPDPEVQGHERIKILDFGIAKLMPEISTNPQLTASFAVMGTPAYMSPEQCRESAGVDRRTDLYALGVILFRMLCGRLPFNKQSFVEYYAAHKNEEPPSVASFNPRVSLGLANIVARLLEKNPDKRFQTAADLLDALGRVAVHQDDDALAATQAQGLVAPDGPKTEPSATQPGVHPAELLEHAGGVLWCVPPLPRNFLARDATMSELIAALCGEIPEDATTAAKYGIQGMGGLGKTVLAAAVVQSRAARRHFADGVYWLTVGQNPQITNLQSELAGALGQYDIAYRSAAEGKQELKAHLAGRRVLLVLDDVWRGEDANWLEVVSEQGVTLITTRNLDVLHYLDARELRLELPDHEQSLSLLADASRQEVETLPPEAGRVVTACGRLPLALVIAGALVRKPGGTWARVLGLLEQARLHKFRGHVRDYPYHNVFQVIAASVQDLAREHIVECAEQCYADLAVFVEGEVIPREPLEVLWGRHGLDEDDVYELASNLDTRALATMRGEGEAWSLKLHDVQRAYARACTADLTRLHGDLIDAYSERCAGGLPAGPTFTVSTLTGDSRRCPYFFARLPYHLSQAGRADEVRALLQSYDWLDAKLRTVGVVELIADFDRIDGATEGHYHLGLIRDALRLSSHVLAKGVEHLPTQLLGRLGYFEAEDSHLESFLGAVRERTRQTWLCPVAANLTPPGGALLGTLGSHADWVFSVALSADGNCAFSGSKDRTVKLWNPHTGELLRSLAGHDGAIRSVATDATGARVLSGSQDCTARLWDAATGAHLHTLSGHQGAVLAVALSADGRRALTGSADGGVKLWDAESGVLRRTFTGHDDWVFAVALSADGRLALSGSDDGALKLWDAESGDLLRTLEERGSMIRAVALDASGCRALSATGGNVAMAKVWDTESGALCHQLTGHSSWLASVALSTDGNRALSGSEDATLKLWDAESGALTRTFQGHSSSVLSVAFGANGDRVLSGSKDGTVKLWDVHSPDVTRHTFAGHDVPISAVALDPGASKALSGAVDGSAKLWDTASGRLWRTLDGHGDAIKAVALGAGGRRALTGSKDNTAQLWDTATGESMHTFFGHASTVFAAALSADGKVALTGSSDRTARLWDTRSGAHLSTLTGHKDSVMAVALNADGTRALTGSDDRTARLWDTRTGELLRTFSGHASWVFAVSLSPDGKSLLSGSSSSEVMLWSTDGEEPVHTFEGNLSAVGALTFCEGGERALSGVGARVLELWDVRTGTALVTFAAEQPIAACTFCSAGRLLFAGDQAGRIHLLRLVEPTAGAETRCP